MCVWGGGEGVWAVPDSKKHSEKSLEGDGHYGLLSEFSSSDVLLVKAMITLHPTKYIHVLA